MSRSKTTDFAGRVVARIAALDRVDLALRLTLLTLLLRPIGGPGVRPALLALAGAGLILPGILRAALLWWAIAALLTLRVLLDWPLADNHSYLFCYWCGAIALAVSADDVGDFLAHNGRWLIGLVFAFATLWKLWLAPDYMSGVAFRVTLVADPRFEALARLVGGVTPEWLEAARSHLQHHADAGPAEGAGLVESARLLALARFATLWTVICEGAIALCFLWARGHGPSRLRDACLLIFCATTYAVAPVAGFGWLLLAMGIAQCEPASTRTRALYLGVYGLVLCYREVPWLQVAADLWSAA